MVLSHPIHIVWFKRDLRIHDHAPLAQAAERGPVLPLYIIEPSVVRAHDFSPAHWTFIRHSLHELRERLAALGQPLIVRVGEAVPVLEALSQQAPIAGLWAHEETGNAVTYARDRAVRRWARTRGIPLTEIPQHGVVRRLKSRDGWAGIWERRMRQPLTPSPSAIQPVNGIELGVIPTHAALGLAADQRIQIQPGGETHAHRLLTSFLEWRGQHYQRDISSPLTAPQSCSRLSPHLAWGTISLREVVQQTRTRRAALQMLDPDARAAAGGDPRALTSFESRLRWHCHFMQKLEDEPAIEFEHFVRAYNGLREHEFNRERYEAWCSGHTGYPMIDACMRSLEATGWLNFRMRAMIVSFAAYDLWLHWREFGHFLARQWLDYEPGIHYSQIQMQSGTTGINTLRIYSPVKQGQDQDPQGVFVRRWVPELSGVADSFIHAPWLMPLESQHASGCQIGKHYPAPIVDHTAAVAHARQRIAEVRRRADTRLEAEDVQQRHGSRRRPNDRQRPRRRKNPNQLELDL